MRAAIPLSNSCFFDFDLRPLSHCISHNPPIKAAYWIVFVWPDKLPFVHCPSEIDPFPETSVTSSKPNLRLQDISERDPQVNKSIETSSKYCKMPTWGNDSYDSLDFHEQQLRHYGLKNGLTPRATSTHPSQQYVERQPNYVRNEANGMPVPPKRKAVPETFRYPPPSAPMPGPRSPRTQSPEGTRLIYTRPDGRYDPSTIRMETSKYTPPVSPVTSRPTSRSSSRAPATRANSDYSQNNGGGRSDSAGERVRRLSSSLKEKAGIFGMGRDERVMYRRSNSPSAEEFAAVAALAKARPNSRPNSSGSMSRGQKIALKLSKAADPFKGKGRKGSNDSSMSMNITDTAPEGEMLPCAQCFRPILTYATKGLCQPCHRQLKGGR